MNRSQRTTIECLTTNMQQAAPYLSREHMIFTIQPLENGFMVCGVTDCETMAWHQSTFQALAFVGPRGGVRNYKEFR